MDTKEISGFELMGDNIREKVKYCGENSRLYPLCKIIHPENAVLEDHCQLMDFVFVDAGKGLRIGKYSTLTWHVLIEGGGNTDIGHRVFLGPGSKVLTSTYALDGYYSIEHLPGNAGKILYGDIVIEDDAYIGANCTVFPGTVIREGAVLGANSLAKGELEPWTIYAGSPCKQLRKRIKPSKEKAEALNQIDWR